MRLFNLISTISTCFYRRFKIHRFLSGKNWNQVVWYSLHQDVAHGSNISSAIVWMFWKFFFWAIWGALRNDDYVLRGEREHGRVQSGDPVIKIAWQNWLFLLSDSLLFARERCLELSNGLAYIKLSRSPRNTEASRFLSARQIAPRTKHFQKNFPQNTTQCPWRGEKIRDWPGLKDLALA